MKISLVIPCYNEEATVETFYGAATTVLNEIEDLSYEMIFVNDGSRDSTRQKLKELAEKDERVKVVNFSRNFGQQAAILCGFRVCTGDCAVELDCDLQDPVELIPKMIEKWKEG
ncbi:MAG: glycosyltransferase family 2 protein, partial [Clostridia bacterium]|nr:glycosyltransferase family 2 protein [Clostridia bacterium]